jgi:predicted NACHT family NTPase
MSLQLAAQCRFPPPVMSELIERTLWYREGRETTVLHQQDLVGMAPPVVVLGEAGLGKTRLLEWLAGQPGHAWCTARQLMNRYDPRSLLGNATTLVIDALDEVVARREGDAVDLVLQKLGALGYPRFVLSCGWQTGRAPSQ